MKKLGCGTFVFFIVISIALSANFFGDNHKITKNESSTLDLTEKLDPKGNHNSEDIDLGEGLHTLIGQTADALIIKWGEPERIDLSAYDYEWWIYQDVFEAGYVQVGVEDNQIVTVYAIGEDIPTGLVKIGASYDELSHLIPFEKEVSFNLNNNSYQFKLSDEDLKMRPIIKAEGLFMQLYFDLFTNQLSSIRYLTADTVIKHRPYSIVYRGNLIESKPLSTQQWREVEKGASLQIYQFTNIIRKRHQLKELNWDKETAYVAFLHSKDMNVNEFFSHTSPSHGELKDRLKKQGILYQMAAENIAAKYVDAIAAVEGWLNSEGHRVNLLHEDFTHLGTGVYERYYTQNFITPWE